MSTSTYKPAYTASATITIAPENVASSSTFAAGVESTAISNLSNLFADALVSGKWTAGTTPTVNTHVQIWVYAPISDDLTTPAYPDAIDGTSSAETMTSAGVLRGALRLAATLDVDSTTSNREYPCAPFSVAALFGGRMPTRWGLYISHNTGVNSNSTAGNHSWSYIGIKDTLETV
jgi:hypothetical protein